MVIYPSIASSNPLCYGSTLKELSSPLHLDIEDGNFTPNITFGMKTVKAIVSNSKGPFQVHLMVTNPMDYLLPLKELGVTEIYSHIEALSDASLYREECSKLGIRVCYAVKADTALDGIWEELLSSDGVLFLTSAPMPVEERFSPEAYQRVLEVRSHLPERVRMIADGGIDEEKLYALRDKGIDGVVLGRLIFSFPNPRERIRELEHKFCSRR